MELTHIAQRGGRLSSFLRQEMGMSSGLVNRLKWQQKIFVNGIPRHNDFQVSAGDLITARLEDPAPDYPAEEGELAILYEDAYLLAVDKPAGMLIHPSHACNTGTLANRVAWYYHATHQNSAFHPLTRLDRDTFGIVLLAKNSHIHAKLQASPVQKTYHALVFGSPPAQEGAVDAPIARCPLPSLLRQIHPQGKPCRTEYAILERFDSCCKLALTPVTGRTHQLRLHCAHMGCPILGDPQYGSPASRAFSDSLGLSTQLLCAKQLALTHPVTGETIILESAMDVQNPY